MVVFDNLIVEVVGVDVICDDNNGFVIVILSNGEVLYIYIWLNDVIIVMIFSLLFGIYGVIVIDVNGCVGEGSVIIINIVGLIVDAGDD